MKKILGVIIALTVTSFVLFPFSFTFLPNVNTKMMMALLGLVVLGMRLITRQMAGVGRDFFILSLFALGVSGASLLSIFINNTTDGLYLSYIVSMWVWLSACYFAVNIIKCVHQNLSVELVSFYLIAVCVVQCFLALAIDSIPPLKVFVDSFLSGEGFMGKNEGRLYGLGCALDVAGGRFAAVLVIISCLLIRAVESQNLKATFLLLLAYFTIAVIGNMIGRTTSVGLLVSLTLIVVYSIVYYQKVGVMLVKWFLIIGTLFFIILVFLYNTNDIWFKYLRFGFEGFFSLAELGRWEVHSNEMLLQGFIFPDNVHTWLIGDGYMNDPENDPYYIGESSWGFYKNTDVGYSRFLFYFGIIGLSIFSAFMIKSCLICMARFSDYKIMFALILCINFIIWLKASTDIFLIFAFYLVLSTKENQIYENSLPDPLDI